jgi:nicotinamide phosphoribosyltransferase
MTNIAKEIAADKPKARRTPNNKVYRPWQDPMTGCDAYKGDHLPQHPDNTQLIMANLTARATRHPGLTEVVAFGSQYWVQYQLLGVWDEAFFSCDKEIAVLLYRKNIDAFYGPGVVGDNHVRELHDLGYLPLAIWALPEGTLTPLRVPMMVIYNTDSRFFWLVNHQETSLSQNMWPCVTAATTAHLYRTLMDRFCEDTGGDMGFVPFQGHDFSMRGMQGLEASCLTGMSHLTSFCGTDTMPAVPFTRNYYPTESLIGTSVRATEHSVTQAGIAVYGGGTDKWEGEMRFMENLFSKKYPTGIVSAVSDTNNYWKVMTEGLKRLKPIILDRKPNQNGQPAKVVFRPDSGDPIKIVCGEAYPLKAIYDVEEIAVGTRIEDEILKLALEKIRVLGYFHVRHKGQPYEIKANSQHDYYELVPVVDTPVLRGSLECLWDEFGGKVNAKGYREINPFVGLIYGDSITLQRCQSILEQMKALGFCSTNIVFGIGSYSYQFVTRDTHAMAVKATFGIFGDKPIALSKNPATDDGTKKSAEGIPAVFFSKDGVPYLKDKATMQELENCAYQLIFKDSKQYNTCTLDDVRKRLEEQRVARRGQPYTDYVKASLDARNQHPTLQGLWPLEPVDGQYNAN